MIENEVLFLQEGSCREDVNVLFVSKSMLKYILHEVWNTT